MSNSPTVDHYRKALRPITDRARQDRCAFKTPNGGLGWSDDPLTPARICEHITGVAGCGVGFITPGESTTRLALLDLDSHSGEVPFIEMATTASSICTQLEGSGLRPTTFISSGGKGIHIWLIWDDQQDAHSVRQALTAVLATEGFSPGTAGVARGEIEVFPKQDAVGAGTNGSMAVLPYWNKSELLIDDLGVCFESAGRVAGGALVWRPSDPVPYVENTTPARTIEHGAPPDSIERIAKALASVPDSISETSAATDYDYWRNIVFAVHEASGGSEEGFEAVKAWHDQNPANNTGRRDLRRVWDEHEPRGITRGTLYRLAAQSNPDWDTPTSDGFTDVATGEAVDDDTATSDVANARRLARLMSGRFIYVHAGHGWCVYQDGVYSPCTRGEHLEEAKNLGPLILSESHGITSEKFKKMMAQVQRAMSAAGITAALSLAQSDRRVARTPTDMDSDPDMLNVENGIVLLPTGTLIPHDHTIVMCRQCAAPYYPDAATPLFDKFLRDVSNGDSDWVDQLQRLVGYTVSGRVNEEIIIFMLGGGANGKSVFSNIMRRILNSYVASVPANFLMVSNRDGEAATPSLARLPGIRLAQANEVEAGARLSAQAVKVAASSDAIAARHLHKAAFEFVPTHTLWVRGNHKPIITDTDDGIWRRIRLIPWDRCFGPDEKDVNLEEKLMTEAPGILAWAVQGYRKYKQKGLSPSGRVAHASVTYREESDLVEQWISERGKRGVGLEWVQTQAYQDYRDWCQEQGLQRPMTKRSFTLALDERRIGSKQEGSGSRQRVYVGIGPLL